MKVDLKLWEHEKCNDKYYAQGQINHNAPKGILDESQICAGNDGKDTCQVFNYEMYKTVSLIYNIYPQSISSFSLKTFNS